MVSRYQEESGGILFLKRLAWPCEVDRIVPQNVVWQGRGGGGGGRFVAQGI